jgi:hypothetical protein
MLAENKVFLKDIMVLDNWTRESSEGRNAKEICTFIILNEVIL